MSFTNVVAERSAAVWMLEAVGTDSARRPDQFSAGSPSICAWSALVIGELSSNSGQVSDARALSNSPAPLAVWRWNASAASVSGAGPSRDVQPPAVFEVC
jgi:hypothetical protein